MKKYIIAFVLGAIIFSGISGVTAYTIMANSIEFQSRNNNWNVNNVGDALNSLYTMKTSEDYSTDEKRVGTYIDGKPIYQKTITNLSITMTWVNQYLTQSAQINPLINDVDKIVSISSVIFTSSSGVIFTGSVDIRTGNKWIFYAIEDYPITEITLQYTKTTDTAND